METPICMFVQNSADAPHKKAPIKMSPTSPCSKPSCFDRSFHRPPFSQALMAALKILGPSCFHTTQKMILQHLISGAPHMLGSWNQSARISCLYYTTLYQHTLYHTRNIYYMYCNIIYYIIMILMSLWSVGPLFHHASPLHHLAAHGTKYLPLKGLQRSLGFLLS